MQAHCTPNKWIVYHQVPSFKATSAKLDPTVLLALLLIHLPARLPSTSYFVPKGIRFILFVRKAWVVLMTAACTAADEAEAATMFQSELGALVSSCFQRGMTSQNYLQAPSELTAGIVQVIRRSCKGKTKFPHLAKIPF